MNAPLQRDRAASGLQVTTRVLIASITDGTARVAAVVAAGIVLLTIGVRE